MVLNLTRREEFDLRSAFNSLLRKNFQGEFEYVDLAGLKYFFKRNGFYASEDDLIGVIKRIDLNYDDAISFDELGKCLLFYDDKK